MIKTRVRPKSRVMEVYDEEALVYYSKRFSSEGGKYIDLVEKALLAKYAKGPSLLEIGTASGRFIPFVEEMGWDYTGVDLSKRMLHLSKNNGCNLVQGDAEGLPLRSACFDTAICLHTFHFLPHPTECLKETARVLADGGFLILIFETDNWLRRLAVSANLFESDQYYFTIDEVSGMIEDSGLRFVVGGPVLKFPMDSYRKLHITKMLKVFDSSKYWPDAFATLGFAIGEKPVDPTHQRQTGRKLALFV